MELCQERVVHVEAVQKAADVLRDAPVEGMADLFKVLADPTRVGILLALSAGELCVCDLSELFEVSTSAVSHQLRLLRAHRLVRTRREGKLVYYRLDDHHVEALFSQSLEHVAERGRA